MMQTKDFVNYDDKGVVINYGETIKDQDIALGTGSVIKDKNGKYHAFYTGHNDAYEPKEAVMHAISDDLENWEKVPEDTFYANENYAKNDFRDPYVLYMEDEDCYWMLVTTRSNNTGVIAKYTSKDLKKWNDDGSAFLFSKNEGLEMKKDYVHPAKDAAAIYQWVVYEDGKIDVLGNYVKYGQNDGNPSWPDGVKVLVYVNDTVLVTEDVEVFQGDGNDNSVNFMLEGLNVSRGDKISLMERKRNG